MLHRIRSWEERAEAGIHSAFTTINFAVILGTAYGEGEIIIRYNNECKQKRHQIRVLITEFIIVRYTLSTIILFVCIDHQLTIQLKKKTPQRMTTNDKNGNTNLPGGGSGNPQLLLTAVLKMT